MLSKVTAVSLLAGCAAFLAPIACSSGFAVAQSIGGIEVSVTPYLWIAGPHATTKTPLPNAPTVTSDLSFADVIGHLDGIPFMGSFEMRQGAYGFLGDFIHIGTVAQGIIANTFISAIDAKFGAGMAPLSDTQIVQFARGVRPQMP